MGDQFESECPSIVNNHKTYKTDPFWTKLESMPSKLKVSEYSLYRENDRGWRYNIAKNLPADDMDVNVLKNFYFEMYV